MGVATGAAKLINRSNSLPKLDVSGAAIQGGFEERDPPILLPNQSDDISHLAIDIGGTLTKLVYFSRHADHSNKDDKRKMSMEEKLGISNRNRSYPILGGQLHFVKFETQKLNECLDFISSKQLHRGGIDLHDCDSPDGNATIKATGGGAYKFADLFKERLGVSLDKEDEMGCLVAGANFLLKAIPDEAFTHMKGHKEFVQIDHNDFFPYLLVTIGSGVSINKVDGDGSYQRVTGSSIGGRTYLGLAWLLTKHKSFDELLELSKRGDNRNIDMLVGDIYGGDYSKIGLSSSTIASSFGKVTYESKEPSAYKPEDLSLSLLRMISYNISQISHSTARDYGIKRIVFGGFFICGHAYTMDMISDAIDYWSKGQVQAMFLRHEGFLGALGAFMSYEKHGLDDLMGHHLVERYLMCAPYVEGMIHGPPLGHPNENALVSEGGTDDNAKGRGDGFAHAFSAHLGRMSSSNNNSCEWAPKCPRCNGDMISFTQSNPNEKFWRCPNWNNENGRATFLWKDKASRQQLSETNSMPMQRDNGKEELQDLAVLMEDLKKTIEMQNRFLCASIEEKKEMKKLSDLQNLYLRKIYRVTVFISCIICLALAFLFNLA